MKTISILMIATLFLFSMGCRKKGCTDPDAINYNEKAGKDDGSCVYNPNAVAYRITSDITTPTTIDKTVEICGNIRVTAALTIMPGARLLMCAGASMSVEGAGSFYAVGTAEKPIIIKGLSSTPGTWDYIKFESNNINNLLSFVIVEDGGGNASWNGAIYCYDNARLKMNNTTIKNSQRYGLFIYSETSTLDEFSNMTVLNCAVGAIHIQAKHMSAMEGGSTFAGNGQNYIEVAGGIIDQVQIWKKTQPPYLINYNVSIRSGVTIEKGATFKMGPGSSLTVENNGSLKAIGTSGEPITFTGAQETKGYWDYILFDGSNNNNNEFQFATVSYGGGNASWNGAIYLYSGAKFKMGNSTVSNSQRWGVFNYSGTSTFIDDGNNSFFGNDLGNIGN